MALLLSDEEVAMLMPEGMTKQEKIKEELAELLARHSYHQNWHYYMEAHRELADKILSYLHSQGLVIKMDWTVEPLIIAPSDATR